MADPAAPVAPDLSQLDDEQLAATIAQLKASQADQEHLGATHTTTSGQGYREYDPARGMSTAAQLGAGFDEGIVNLGMHAGNLVGAVSDPDLKEYEHLMEPLTETPGGNLGSFAGTTAAVTPLDLGAAPLTARYLGPAGRFLMAGPVRRGVTSGAEQGALTAEPGERGEGALAGAFAGGALPLTGKAFATALRGLPRSPAAQALLDRGVRLTPGSLEPDSVLNKVEENLRGLPMVGNVIENADKRAWQDTQRGVIQSAAAPGTTIPSTLTKPSDMYAYAEQSYGPLYDQARGFPVTPHVWQQGANQPLADLFDQAANRTGVGATRATRERAGDFLSGQLEAFGDKAQSAGWWDSGDLIDLRSRINEEIRDAGVDQEGKTYRSLLRTARDHVTDSIESQLPPEASTALQTANNAYPNLAIVRDAVRRGADKPGGFTPNDLSMAVRQATDLGEYSRGGGLLRDWSEPARDVFTDRNPRTGMSLETLGPAGLAAYGAMHHPAFGIPAAGIGALAYGTEAGRNLLRGQAPWQAAGRRLLSGVQSVPGARPAIEATGAASRAALVNALRAHGQGQAVAAGTGTQ